MAECIYIRVLNEVGSSIKTHHRLISEAGPGNSLYANSQNILMV
jgi:hypothetical protein